MSELHVVFGTGALGLAVMRELRRSGRPVRMVNRSSRVRFDKDAQTQVDAPMTEDLPLSATTRKGRIRAGIARSLMNLHEGGKLRVAIGRGSDFFGPFATDAALMGSRVFGRALQGKAAQVIGDPDRLHSYTFIDDFGKALVTLGLHDEALGKAWHVPSAAALPTRDFVGQVYAQLGKRTKKKRDRIAAPPFPFTCALERTD